MITDNILVLALAAASIAKILVDVVRMAFPDNRPNWVSPVLAVAFGILAAFLMLMSNGEMITQQTIAQTMIAGILAGGSAVGITELGRKAA
jgi:hypothetical protein